LEVVEIAVELPNGSLLKAHFLKKTQIILRDQEIVFWAKSLYELAKQLVGQRRFILSDLLDPCSPKPPEQFRF
jgi:hypothetical protein